MSKIPFAMCKKCEFRDICKLTDEEKLQCHKSFGPNVPVIVMVPEAINNAFMEYANSIGFDPQQFYGIAMNLLIKEMAEEVKDSNISMDSKLCLLAAKDRLEELEKEIAKS